MAGLSQQVQRFRILVIVGLTALGVTLISCVLLITGLTAAGLAGLILAAQGLTLGCALVLYRALLQQRKTLRGLEASLRQMRELLEETGGGAAAAARPDAGQPGARQDAEAARRHLSRALFAQLDQLPGVHVSDDAAAARS